jgi:hypothetical protein
MISEADFIPECKLSLLADSHAKPVAEHPVLMFKLHHPQPVAVRIQTFKRGYQQ